MPIRLRRIAGVVAAVFAVASNGCASQTPTVGGKAPAPTAAGSPDSAMIEAATVVVAASSRIGRAWPGFWPRDQSFFLTRAERDLILAVTSQRLPADYAPVANVPGVLRGRVWASNTMPRVLKMSGGFHQEFEAGSVVGTAIAMRHWGTRDRLIEALFHEAFHAFQNQRFVDDGLPPSTGFGIRIADSAVTNRADFLRAVEVERRILIAALRAPRDSIPALARTYLAVRHQRLAEQRAIRDAERANERSEGTAFFVGAETAAIALGQDRTWVRDHVIAWLEKPIADFPAEPEIDAALMRHRLYGTGAAIALLIDGIDPEWRGGIQRGGILDLTLAHAVGFRSRGSEMLAANAMQRFAGDLPR